MSVLIPTGRATVRRIWQDALAVAVGLASVAVIVVAGNAGGKALVVGLGGLAGFALLVITAYAPALPERVLLFGIATTLSVSIKVHPFFRQDHLGGAVGLRISITELAVSALLALSAAAALRRGWLRLRIDAATATFAALYLAASLISVYGSSDRVLGWYQLSAVLQAFLLAVVFGSWTWDTKARRWFVGGLLAALLLQSGIAITQSVKPGLVKMAFLGATEYTEDTGTANGKIGTDVGRTEIAGQEAYRPTGMLIHPNVLAGYFVLTLPLAIALALGAETAWQRRLAVLASGAAATALYLSLSRSGWIGSATAIAVGAFLAWKWKAFDLTGQAKAALVAVAIVGAAGLAWKAERIYLRFTETAGDALDFRREYALAAWRMTLDYPFAGVGLNTFTDLVVRYDVSGTSRIKAFPVHNAYLLELAETGFLGGAAFVLMIGALTRATFRAARDAGGEARVIALGIAAGLAGFWATQVSDYFYRIPIMTSLVWAYAGFAIGACGSWQGERQ